MRGAIREIARTARAAIASWPATVRTVVVVAAVTAAPISYHLFIR